MGMNHRECGRGQSCVSGRNQALTERAAADARSTVSPQFCSEPVGVIVGQGGHGVSTSFARARASHNHERCRHLT